MRPFVNFQVFCPCKLSPTSEGALKGLFTRVDSQVIDQFVLGLEWVPLTGTIFP